MGLEMLMARDGQLPRSACRYQRLRGELLSGGGDGGEGEEAVVARSTTVSVRARRPLRLRRRSCKAAAGMRWRSGAPAALGSRKALRLRLLRLVLLLPTRRLAALVAELVRRLAAAVAASAADDCPAIVFSSQWGLPVLSHSASTSSRSSRLRAFYLERSLSAGSGSGAGSPC